jgi:hypothetical protein
MSKVHSSNNVQSALKQQILAGVDNIYVQTLCNTHTGYTMVTTQQILNHLYTMYGQLMPMAMQENDRHFCNAYNLAEQFEMLVQQIGTAQAFAAAGNQAYMAQQIVSNAYNLIHNTGMLLDACGNGVVAQKRTKCGATSTPSLPKLTQN